MKYRNLGSSGLKVSTLCLGGMTFGEPEQGSFMHGVASTEEVAFSVMNRALELGINFVDVADVYGQDGLSERVMGHWFKRDKRRDELVLATKFRFRMSDGPNGTGASRYRIMRTVEESLRRLGTDRIDLYQIHMQDIETPEEETLRALDDLVRQGKVLYIGCSNYAAYRLVDSLWISKTEHLNRFVTMQLQYSLIERGIERELVPVARKHGLGILPWSPLAGGFLSGKFRKDQAPPSGARLTAWQDNYKRLDNERNWRVLDKVLEIAARTESHPTAVSLAWLLSKPEVSSVIFGARTTEQLEQNVHAATLQLAASDVAALDEVSVLDWGYPYNFIQRIQQRW